MSKPATLNFQSTFSPCPNTTRAQPVSISTDQSGKMFAYPAGNNVIIRSTEEESKVMVCTRHSSQVTCARLAPSGYVCASGDVDGNVLIWATKEGNVVQLSKEKAINGPIRDIAWDNDQQRVVAVGEARDSKGAAFAASGGNQIGQIIGHNRNIFSVDLRKERPFRVATGGQDTILAFHEGPPFKFSKSHNDSAGLSGTVNSIKFSPDNTMIAAVSGSDSILILDGKTGDVQKSIKTQHKGSVYSVAWSADNNTVVTASADKSVRAYSVTDGNELWASTFGAALGQMQQGVMFSASGWVAVNLRGDLNFLDITSGVVSKTWRGHNKHVVGMNYNDATGRLLTVGADGKALSWDAKGFAEDIAVDAKIDTATGLAVLPGGAVVAACGESVIAIDQADFSTKAFAADVAHPLAIGAIDDSTVALVYKSALKIASGGSIVAEQKLTGFDGSCVSVHGNLIAVGGDKAVKVFEFAAPGTLTEKVTFGGSHTTQVTAVKFNAAGTAVASGDSSRQIFVWNPADGSVLFDELVFHASRINCLAWSPGDALLASGSVDSSIILWDLPNKKRITQNAAHQGGVSAICFTAENQLFSSGGDCCVNRWTW